MPNAKVWKGVNWEDSGVQLLARIVGVDAANIVQADVSAISFSLYSRDDLAGEDDAGTEVVAARALTVSSVVFNSLQTDARWTFDTTGYNFRYSVPATDFATPDLIYRAEIKFTPASGEAYHVCFDIDVKPLNRS